MHDLSLSTPVEVERDPDAKHRGPCFDGVYGCHLCWNAENDGKGTTSTCDRCDARDVFTRVCRASDEPVLYAWCEPCREEVAARRAQEAAEYEASLEECRYCHGSREDPCLPCRGSGVLRSTPAPCAECHGQGNDCKACDGEGSVYPPDETCNACDGDGQSTNPCSKCGGSGVR